jgi:hypothetical protein
MYIYIYIYVVGLLVWIMNLDNRLINYFINFNKMKGS